MAENSDAKRSKSGKTNGAVENSGAAEEATMNIEQDGDTGRKSSKDNDSEPPKDYIHVRARRGQATDAHSLAERVSRQGITIHLPLVFSVSETQRCNGFIARPLSLSTGEKREDQQEDEVPAGSRAWLQQGTELAAFASFRSLPSLLKFGSQVTGKAVMLDEIINYVQSLQQQVEVSTFADRSCELEFLPESLLFCLLFFSSSP